jgi:hypothetical protein
VCSHSLQLVVYAGLVAFCLAGLVVNSRKGWMLALCLTVKMRESKSEEQAKLLMPALSTRNLF